MRKVLYIVAILLTCLLITVGMSVCFLRSANVQTTLVRLVTSELSRALGSEAHIGHIEYQFPARLRLDSLYLSDQQGDTLAYIEEAYAHFSPFALRSNTLCFRRIAVHGVKVDAHRLENGTFNYHFLIDAFASEPNTEEEPDTTTAPSLRVDIGKVELLDLDVRYDSHHIRLEELTVPQLLLVKDSIYTNAQVRHAVYNDLVKLEACELRIATLDTLMLHVDQAQYLDFQFSGDFGGRLDSLTATHLRLSHQQEELLDGDVYVSGLPNLDSTYIHANCKDLNVRPGHVQDIVSDITQRPFILPKEVWHMGTLHYQGLLQGYLSDLTLRGAFRSSVGTITTDGRLHASRNFKTVGFSGKLASRKFRLGRMLGRSEVGDIAFALTAQGGQSEQRAFHVQGQGMIHSFTYRDYTYQDLQLDVQYEDEQLTADVAIEDEHLDLSISALADLGEDKQVGGHIQLNRFEPGPLGLSEHFDDATLSFRLDGETYFSSLHDLTGYIELDSFKLVRPMLEDSIMVENLEIKLDANDSLNHRFLLTSDLLTARLEGQFDYTTLGTTFQKLGMRYLPSLFSAEQKKTILAKPSHNRFDLYLYGHQIQKMQYMLGLNWRLGNYPVLKAFVDEPQQMWGIQGYISDIQTVKQQLKDITLSSNNKDKRAELTLSAAFQGGEYILQTYAEADSIRLDLTAEGDSSQIRGGLHIASHFSRYAGKPLVDVQFYRSDILFSDSIYHIAPSAISISMADTSITIDHFHIGTTTQFVEADGVISHRSEDTLRVELGDINASYVMPYVVPEKTIIVNGNISGTAVLHDLFRQPMFACDVLLKDGGINNCVFGDAIAKVYMGESGKDIIIEGDVYRKDLHKVARVDGRVDLRKEANGYWGLEIQPDSIPLGFITHWTNGILDKIGGTASGQVKVFGVKGGTWVLAKALTHNGHFTIPFTGCTYSFSDSCYMDSTAIRFPNIHLTDEEGHPLLLNGELNHNSFKDFQFNLGLDVDHAMAIHMPDKEGEMLQGKVYASGHVQVAGDEKVVRLNADAKTVGNSRFRLSIAGPGSAADNGFITFVDHNITEQIQPEKDYSLHRTKRKTYSKLPTKFLLGLNIEGTPELLFQLVLNDKTGDMIQARGEGALRLTYDDSQGLFRLMGTYSILNGDMGFTFANTFHKNFTIGQGSTIAWNGDPADPMLDVTAKYHVTASLKDLFGDSYSTVTTGRTSIPINTCVNMKGTLANARVRFALEFPSSDEALRTQILSVINTEEMMMRQVVYLLVFGKFYTPDYMHSSQQQVGLNETYSILSSTVTGQINSWLGKLTDSFTMGFNIRADDEGASGGQRQEYEANFQIRPIPRLVINGNVGYRYNDISNRPFFGDLDVEYMITPNGKVRAKAYTHSVDKYSLKQASTIQGVGFIFRHDFNWPKIGKKEQGARNQEPGTRTEMININNKQ